MSERNARQRNQEQKLHSMKKAVLYIVAFGIAVVAALSVYNSRHAERISVALEQTPNDPNNSGAEGSSGTGPSRLAKSGNSGKPSADTLEPKTIQPRPAARPEPRLAHGLAIHPAFETLLDSQSSFQRKEEIWSELTSSGKLDRAIGELEERARSNPASPEIPAALGRAYLQKAGSIDDVREQGILGMKADQTFETALALDSKSWDARFWKAMAMSHWPVQLNKTPEVVEDLVMLVEQQEQMAPKPEFAQTYVLLGDQYQKVGHPDHARQAWERGLTVFPDQSSLKEKLAKQP